MINSEYGASEEDFRAEEQYWREHPEEAKRHDRTTAWVAGVGAVVLVVLLFLL